jgi:CheY-like chemotaxis protein
MSRLIDDLLDIARISSGKLALRLQRMRLRLALEMALETARPNIDAAGVRLELGLAAADLEIDADATRLAQVFSNLLNNAAKFTDAGGRVALEAAREGDAAVVRVADSGIGFPPEIAEQLFEPFAQAHPERARAGGGLGIGLALARGIVALHGGSISARSRGASRGSEFIVRLPLASAALNAKDARAQQHAAAPVRGVRVLVADDNRDAADSLGRILALYGYDVRVAYDGAAAIAAAEAFRPAAAVLDIGMPGVNGYDVARALRERHGAALRLVALTGWGQAADRQRASEAGFDHHLTKPMDPGVLHELLGTVKV